MPRRRRQRNRRRAVNPSRGLNSVDSFVTTLTAQYVHTSTGVGSVVSSFNWDGFAGFEHLQDFFRYFKPLSF
jgi:hypothetical protein